MSEDDYDPRYLAYPMYTLFHIWDPEDPNHIEEMDFRYFAGDDLERLPVIADTMRWALAQPDFDFTTLLPLSMDNDAIRRWLERLLVRVEREGY